MTTPTTLTPEEVEREREAFEGLAKDDPALICERRDDGSYTTSHSRCAWEYWLLRAAQAKADLAAQAERIAELTRQRDILCEHLLVMDEVKDDSAFLVEKLRYAVVYCEKCIPESDFAIAARAQQPETLTIVTTPQKYFDAADQYMAQQPEAEGGSEE